MAPAVLFILLSAAAAPSPEIRTGTFVPSRPMPHRFRLLDWNIDRGTRLEALAAAMRTAEPDIAVLQEVDRNAARSGNRDVARELATRLATNFIYADAFAELGQGAGASQGQAILTALPIRATRVLRYRRQTGFWKPVPFLPEWGWLQRREGGRIALIAEFGQDRTELVIYNVHLESRGPGAARLAQLRETLADARRFPPDLPVVIAGDLNTKYRPALAQRIAEHDGFRNCFDGRIRTHRLIGSLDWIFVRGRAICEHAQVIRGTRVSDHDPLTVDLTLP